MSLEQLLDDFSLLPDWEDRYRYVIELGKGLEALPETERTEANKVQGCASQVWLATEISEVEGQAHLRFRGDSDAMIVKGLIAILFDLYSDKKADEILGLDAKAAFAELGLQEHITPQRSNGFFSMVERIRRDAAAAAQSA